MKFEQGIGGMALDGKDNETNTEEGNTVAAALTLNVSAPKRMTIDQAHTRDSFLLSITSNQESLAWPTWLEQVHRRELVELTRKPVELSNSAC